MAPGFFSRMVKASSPTKHERERSESESPRSSGQRTRTQSLARSSDVSSQKAPTPDISSTDIASTNTAPTISINTTTASSKTSPNKTSLSTLNSTSSSQPNVTVVPPSPLSGQASLSSHTDNDSAEHPDRRIYVNSKSAGEVSTLGRTTSVTSSNSAGNTTPTPTPIPSRTPPPPSALNSSATPTPAAASVSTPNIPSTNHTQATSMPKAALDAPPNEVRRTSSSKSLNVSTKHARAATTPETTRDTGHGEGGSIITMSPIVESPRNIREFPSSQQSFPESAGTGSATLLAPRDSDAVSLVSTTTNGGKEKKRPWRKSTSRKPTGLAGAIAASGMALANPTLSASQQASFGPAAIQAQAQQNGVSSTARKTSNPGSPPYSSRSPPGSTNHVKGKSADLSPKSSKSKRQGSMHTGVRRPSISVQSDNASEYYPDEKPEYYSGLDGSSDEDDDSESSGLGLDLGMDDIPVTGFAVASNKRNADFHELFPNIPEGDYLIEDYGCALQREILIQGRIYISENHICFHANIFGWITDLSIPMCEITQLEKRMTAFVIPNAIQITTRQAKYTFASFLSRDTTYDVIFNIWRLARPDEVASSSRPSLDSTNIGLPAKILVASATSVNKVQRATQCTCGKEGHYSETALDCILPGTPDRINNLMFASGFIKEFGVVDQKLTDIQMSDWQPTALDSNLLTRNMSYIKPLNSSIGPKSTKCEIKDEMVHNDSEQFISTVTTTRTPDVPSGGVFSVKTKTCLTWASSVSTRVLVTTQVEWTGRSFIRSIIERSAIDGQKTYHAELEAAMRKYIADHQSEFLPEGIDALALVPAEAAPSPDASTPPAALEEKLSTEEQHKRREKERNQRGLQWAWDTFEGASQVAIRSTKGALELIHDAWEQSSSTTIMWFVIVALIMSNVWTLVVMGSREETGRRKEMKKMEEREKWVQGVVTALWDEMGKQQKDILGGSVQIKSLDPGSWKKELGEVQNTLEQLEQRMKNLKENLEKMQSLHMEQMD